MAAMTAGGMALAANHREAPITALDRTADIADVFAFVSYDDPTKVTFIMTVDPLLEPSNGPNYFPFDPEILYAIRIDNDYDASEDVTFEFRFETEQRLPGVFTAYVGAGDGIVSPTNSPAPVPPGTPIVPPAITALDGPGSEGLGLRQTYSVTMVREGRRFGGGDDDDDEDDENDDRRARFGRGLDQRTVLAEGLFAVPSNVGKRTMPDYPALAQQGIYGIGDGISVYAATVEDPFWIDLGAAFDSLNFRVDAFPSGTAGVLTPTQDEDDTQNFAPDSVSGFNVNAIAIEVPIELVTRTGQLEGPSSPDATIGAWATTSRPQFRRFSSRPDGPTRFSRSMVQIQRMGNPLLNELIIGTGSKDAFSRSEPKNDADFAGFALDPVLARVLNAIYGIDVPDAPRFDLLPLVKYLPPIAAPGTPEGPIADLLRLNTGVPPTPMGDRKRLGALAGDLGGYPNGRRLSDDVTDIATRVVAGFLAGFEYPIGDGVNVNNVDYLETFPYLGYALSGRDRRHIDPGEDGLPIE